MRQESLPPHELAPALMKRGRGLKRLWDNLMAQPSAGARVDEARARIETMMVISWVVILSVAPALMKRGRGLKLHGQGVVSENQSAPALMKRGRGLKRLRDRSHDPPYR